MTPEEATPPATPQEPKTGTSPSLLNEAQLASLTKTEEICRTALKPEYLAPLITLNEDEEAGEDHITQAGIQAALDLCTAARGKSSQAVSATGEKEDSTAEEGDAKKALVALVREFQARARQKHFSKHPEILAEYGIGLKIYNSRAILEGWAQTIHNKTATDTLPRITAAKRTALLNALTVYKGSQTEQAGAIGQASAARIDRDSLVEQATERRLWIQFAADAEWPHTAPANAPIRREFQLPATRPFVG